MSKVRVFENPDGSVRVLRPNLNSITDSRDDLDKETLKDITLSGLPYKDVDAASLPGDRANRNKWRMRGNSVEVDHAIPDRPDTPRRP